MGEEYALYGCPGIESTPSHWLNRRRAAARVCELASQGNCEAVDVMCSRIAKDGSWMVRQLALVEACRMLAGVSKATHGIHKRGVIFSLTQVVLDNIFEAPGHLHHQMPEPLPEAQEGQQEFKMVVDKTVGRKLGVEWDSETLRIKTVAPTGVVAQWNRNHPELAMKPGDHIVGVNGIRHNVLNIVNECNESKTLELAFIRDQMQTDQDVIVDVLCGELPRCDADTLTIFVASLEERKQTAD